MEEILGILNSRRQIIKLGFQIYILGKKETLEKKRRWRISSFATKLVSDYVTSDVVSLVRC